MTKKEWKTVYRNARRFGIGVFFVKYLAAQLKLKKTMHSGAWQAKTDAEIMAEVDWSVKQIAQRKRLADVRSET